MFVKRTVFVVGAGASVPYGFSSGAGLAEQARSYTPEGLQAIAQNNVGIHDARFLSEALRQSRETSIDSLLELRPELRPAGKKIMALMLLEQERAARDKYPPCDGESDWIGWLYQMMTEGANSVEAFVANPVSIVTFNYDRLIEHTLAGALSARYGLTEAVAIQNTLQIPIVHLHGSIGPLVNRQDNPAIPFGTLEDRVTNFRGFVCRDAEQNIKIVHDADDESEEFLRAQRLFEQAEQVVFLGFGFGRDNVRRLGVHKIPTTANIYANVFGRTDAEVNLYVRPVFPPRTNGREFDTARTPLRAFLRDRVFIAS